MPFLPSTRKRRSNSAPFISFSGKARTFRSSIGSPADSNPSGSHTGEPVSGEPGSRTNTIWKNKNPFQTGNQSARSSTQTLTSSSIPDPRASIDEDSDSDTDVPLSLSFMRRPSRSKSMDHNIEQIMRLNTLYNSRLGSKAKPENGPSPQSSTSEEEPEYVATSPVSFPGSPVSADLEDPKYGFLHPLVRKKSGELVKSSLRLHRFNSSRSLPATPTYKQVHFGGGIDVKYFRSKDKPSSISVCNSPDMDSSSSSSSYDSDNGGDSSEQNSDNDEDDLIDKELSALDIADTDAVYSKDVRTLYSTLYQVARECVEKVTARNLTKFEHLMKPVTLDKSQFSNILYQDEIDREVPVILESCKLSDDKTAILGHVSVRNVSYSKAVTVRYTFDDWKTVVNIEASYTSNIPKILRSAGYDRFLFQISVPMLFCQYFDSHMISGQKAPEVAFCIRYTSGGQEFWDNNFGHNYMLKFLTKRRSLPQGDAFTSSEMARRYVHNVLKDDADLESNVSGETKKSEQAISPHTKPTSLPAESCLRKSKAFKDRNGKKLETDALNASIYSICNELEAANSPGTPAVLRGSTGHVSGIKHNFDVGSPDSIEPLDPLFTPASEQKGIDVFNILPGPRTGSEEKEDADSKPRVTPSQETGVNSESYQDLLKKYCFFKSPKTVSSFLQGDENDADQMLNNGSSGRGFY